MSKCRKWTPEEEQNLALLISERKPYKEIAFILDRSVNAVRNRAYVLKLTRQRGWFPNPMQGRKHTEETKRKIAETRKLYVREKHPSWQGGKRINHSGYVEIHMPEHPRARANGYVFEHILVAEKMIGRPLKPDEVVHHANRVKTDNQPENLKVILKGEHSHIHAQSKTGVYLTCPVCGNQFYVKPSHIKARTTCSFKCAGKLFSKYYTGNPRDYRPTKIEKEEIICSIQLS